MPLDYFGEGFQYGNWSFVQFLTERWPAETGSMPTLVLDLWERMQARSTSDPDRYSLQALHDVITAKGTSFTSLYGQFADGNRRPASTYSEGGAAAYDPIRPAATKTLSSSRRSTPKYFARIDHLSSIPIRLKPASGLTQGDWKLRVKVDMPAKATAPVARVAVYKKNGNVTSTTVPFKKTGFGSKVVGFSSKDVKYVELVVANASRRTTCWNDQDSPFSCLGTPTDDGRRFDFNASIFRS